MQIQTWQQTHARTSVSIHISFHNIFPPCHYLPSSSHLSVPLIRTTYVWRLNFFGDISFIHLIYYHYIEAIFLQVTYIMYLDIYLQNGTLCEENSSKEFQHSNRYYRYAACFWRRPTLDSELLTVKYFLSLRKFVLSPWRSICIFPRHRCSLVVIIFDTVQTSD